MCCGNEHDNDPKYKRARCCACFNLAGEITFLLTLCWAIFAAALAILYMCGLHAAVSSSLLQAPLQAPHTGSCRVQVSRVPKKKELVGRMNFAMQSVTITHARTSPKQSHTLPPTRTHTTILHIINCASMILLAAYLKRGTKIVVNAQNNKTA